MGGEDSGYLAALGLLLRYLNSVFPQIKKKGEVSGKRGWGRNMEGMGCIYHPQPPKSHGNEVVLLAA